MNNLKNKVKDNWYLTNGKAWNKLDMYVDNSHKGSPFTDQQYLLIDEHNKKAYITTEYCWSMHCENSSMSDYLEFDCKKVDLNDYLKNKSQNICKI